MTTSILIDSDNAMGAPWGDVDDGFAIVALLLSSLHVAALASVAGNASEEWADRDNHAIARLCGFAGPLLRGASRAREWDTEASRFLSQCDERLRIAAIGPLTNIAGALRAADGFERNVEELVVVGGNSVSRGLFPPFWPHEFNLTKDREAARIVFESELPLTVVPLNVAYALRVDAGDLACLPGTIGGYLRDASRRWLWRCRLTRLRGWFPVWDLVAAIYLIAPELFETSIVRTSMPRAGWLRFGQGSRQVRLVGRFDRDAVWNRFLDLLPRSG